MRNPDRIKDFCDRLAECWRCVPDWRFGQLMSNVLGDYVNEKRRDIFFPEDDEMIEFFEEHFSREGVSPYGTLKSRTQEEQLEEGHPQG